MAVTGIMAHREDGRAYVELPSGLRPWFANGRVTGDASAGLLRMDLQFNPAASVEFSRYVSVNHIGIRTTDAAAIADLEVQISSGHWEKTSLEFTTSALIDEVNLRTTSAATVFGGRSHDTHYLGRFIAGTTATLNMTTLNVNLMQMNISASGLIADRPFVPYDFWRL